MSQLYNELIGIVEQEMNNDRISEIEYHLHPDNMQGGSQIAGCPLSVGARKAGFKFPPPENHLKNDPRPMDCGKLHHEYIQTRLMRVLKTKEGLNINVEVYVPWAFNYKTGEALREKDYIARQKLKVNSILNVQPIKDWIIIRSPIDVMVKKGGYSMEVIQFRNVTQVVPVVHDIENIVAIMDIKGQSKYGYFKTLKGEFSTTYKGQFHGYMFACNLKQLGLWNDLKEKLYFATITSNWSDELWDLTLKRLRRQYIMKDAVLEKNSTQLAVSESFCSCIEEGIGKHGTIDWYHCPLSITYVEEDSFTQGDQKLKLGRLCDSAMRLLIQKAKSKYFPGATFTRGRSHITIIDPTPNFTEDSVPQNIPFRPDEIIYCQNKSGTIYRDSVIYAEQNYEVR